MERARCKGERIFFSETVQGQAVAKRLCTSCPVQSQCLAYAILNREEHGIWGGCNWLERRRIIAWGAIIPEFDAQQRSILEGRYAPVLAVVHTSWEQELEGMFDTIVERDFELGLASIFDDALTA